MTASAVPGPERAPLVAAAGGSLVAGLLAAVLVARSLNGAIALYDPGISTSAGVFILHGLVPYRDFWLLYGPLAGYVSAAVTALTPPDTAVVKVMGLALIVCLAAAGTFVLWPFTRPPFAIAISAVAAALAPTVGGLELSSWQCAMTAALVAAGIAARSRSRRGDLLTGIVAGVAFLFRLDVGAYIAIALALTYRRRDQLIGFLAVTVPVTVAYLLLVPLDRLFEQLIWYPLVGVRTYRSLPNPSAPITAPECRMLREPTTQRL